MGFKLARRFFTSFIFSPNFYIGIIFVILVQIFFSSELKSTICHDEKQIKTVDSPTCSWIFDRYVSSQWERFWFKEVSHLHGNVCTILKQPEQYSKSVQMVEKIIKLQSQIAQRQSFDSNDYEIFSQMIYRYDCPNIPKGKQETAIQLIEPLIGLLRDPLTICTYKNLPKHLILDLNFAVQSKRFVLLGSSAPFQTIKWNDVGKILPWLQSAGSQLILFDLGSSLFGGDPKTDPSAHLVGARWFHEYFQSISMRFDRIIAFEFQNLSAEIYWEQIPESLLGRLTFINVGVQSEGRYNPWRILQSIAKKEDYVLVKLDIDTPTIEMDLIHQVVRNTTISSLIDEMFFEMHVGVGDMALFWGKAPGTLNDSYFLFRQLRQMGIRMHSWP